MSSTQLQTTFEPFFRNLAKRQGAAIFAAGKVRTCWDDASGATAMVGGANGSEFLVELRWPERSQPGDCSCPNFEYYGPCKHMWAVLLHVMQHRETSGYADSVEPDGAWGDLLAMIQRDEDQLQSDPWATVETGDSEVRYILDLALSIPSDGPCIRVVTRKRLKNGSLGAMKPLTLGRLRVDDFPDQEDRQILMLLGASFEGQSFGGSLYRAPTASPGHLTSELARELLPRMARTGRLDWSGSDRQGHVEWSDGEAWRFRMGTTVDSDGNVDGVQGWVERGEERLELGVVEGIFRCGLILGQHVLSRLDDLGAWPWLHALWFQGPVTIPGGQQERAQALLERVPPRVWSQAPGVVVPALGTPIPHLLVRADEPNAEVPAGRVACHVSFDYGLGQRVEPESAEELVSDSTEGRVVRRDFDAEREALASYLQCGGRRSSDDRERSRHGTVAARQVPEIVARLLTTGWTVQADGHPVRRPGLQRMVLSSGQDWFELSGSLDFDGQNVPLPELLKAARSGEKLVKLGDGSHGIMPEDWLRSWGLLDLAVTETDDGLRFQGNQGWLLDALLAGRQDVEGGQALSAYRAQLLGSGDIEPEQEARSFVGELRPYQRHALGWFDFLKGMGLGGCLADDMGLGKTVQVLALLESRRPEVDTSCEHRRVSLVVAPRSLVFNWIDEAARFTPELRVLDYTGVRRKKALEEASEIDLLVTTYGTLRLDAAHLAEKGFDYVILDEATAIKNAKSQAAKAARLLRAEHRLALSGTPVENNLGELWSLMEFLNPGMLGHSKRFQHLAAKAPGQSELPRLAKALRPFLLRRTKEEVLTELPPKTEQVVHCELSEEDRVRYNELRDHFRAELLGAKSSGRAAGNPIQVLEGLLRLRQCASHPGLIDPELRGEDSAKLKALLPRLEELASKGHKVLVFSQFTKFLGIVRERLEGQGLTYEYLDGSTRKRKEKVDRFQNDPDCPIFLISLKAGGHGLNLVAAEYVFLLDPWWNPAVEAQAVDRAHRMGQTKPVFAYRFITKDTVEEKVQDLQKQKRELAQAILGEGTGALKGLTQQDLEQLFS